MRKVSVEEAIGQVIGHDITMILPGKVKKRAFQRGHVIKLEDVSLLKDLGKLNVYVMEEGSSSIHEDEGALMLASAASGAGLEWTDPNQGRVNIKAKEPGLLKVDVERLNDLNHLDKLVFATIHTNSPVSGGEPVAGTRIVPVDIEEEILHKACQICSLPEPLLCVKPYKPLWVAVVVTGSEVNSGRIQDGFGPLIRKRVAPFGARWMGQVIVPDDAGLIEAEIRNFIAEGAELILVTGGMSVDADDVTPRAIQGACSEMVFYGAPVLPGSQFMLAYQGSVAVCGVPGGALFGRRVTLDLLLPRIFAGDRIKRSEIVALGHGGFCHECYTCHYPLCPFGKASNI